MVWSIQSRGLTFYSIEILYLTLKIINKIGEIMKKIFLALLAMFIGGLLMINNSQAVDLNGKKVLVVYYSLSGNTKAVAEEIKNATGGDIFELQTHSNLSKQLQ